MMEDKMNKLWAERPDATRHAGGRGCFMKAGNPNSPADRAFAGVAEPGATLRVLEGPHAGDYVNRGTKARPQWERRGGTVSRAEWRKLREQFKAQQARLAELKRGGNPWRKY